MLLLMLQFIDDEVLTIVEPLVVLYLLRRLDVNGGGKLVLAVFDLKVLF